MKPTNVVGLAGMIVVGVVVGYALRARNTKSVLNAGTRLWLGSLRTITGGK